MDEVYNRFFNYKLTKMVFYDKKNLTFNEYENDVDFVLKNVLQSLKNVMIFVSIIFKYVA